MSKKKYKLVNKRVKYKLDRVGVIKRFKSKHGNRYDYSDVVYSNTRTKVIINCLEHGPFEQVPFTHMNGVGCPKCWFDKVGDNKRHNTSDFIKKAINTHGTRYKYVKAVYINNHTKLIITCDKHGDFKQIPSDHYYGAGCPKCRRSKGESKLAGILDNLGIKYTEQYMFENSIYRYDFYLPELNILIEYDGEQHFKPSRWSKDKKAMMTKLEDIKTRDVDKNTLASLHNIPLIRIPYTHYKDLDKYLLFKLSKIFKYSINGKYYKNFLEFCRGEKVYNETKSNDIKEYLIYKGNKNEY